MIIKNSIFITFFISAFFFFLFSPVLGQIGGIPALNTENFFLSIVPNLPKTGEQVEALLTSYSFDLDRSFITWLHNGKKVLEGRGEKRYSFKADEVGQKETIKAIVATPSGSQLERLFSFAITDVDLLWTAKTSVPVAYAGKALPSLRSTVKVTAVPHLFSQGGRLPASNLIYKWFLGDSFRDDLSGYNRQSFEFQIPTLALNSQRVKVEITSFNGEIKTQKEIFIPIVEPKILIYEEHPLEGPRFSRAFTEVAMPSSGQMDFRASPYFFSNKESLTYRWLVGGKAAEKTGAPHFLNLKISEGFFGPVAVNLQVKNPLNIFQQKEVNLKINVE